jgi:hypothetical protein
VRGPLSLWPFLGSHVEWDLGRLRGMLHCLIEGFLGNELSVLVRVEMQSLQTSVI